MLLRKSTLYKCYVHRDNSPNYSASLLSAKLETGKLNLDSVCCFTNEYKSTLKQETQIIIWEQVVSPECCISLRKYAPMPHFPYTLHCAAHSPPPKKKLPLSRGRSFWTPSNNGLIDSPTYHPKRHRHLDRVGRFFSQYTLVPNGQTDRQNADEG